MVRIARTGSFVGGSAVMPDAVIFAVLIACLHTGFSNASVLSIMSRIAITTEMINIGNV